MAQVDLRIARLDLDEAEVSGLFLLLDASEQKKAARYRFPEHRRRFIVRRARLREWLAQECGATPKRISFLNDEYGKPSVRGWDGRFSASHSGERMAVVFSSRPVGCDIEQVKPDFDWRPLAERMFAPGERAALAKLGDEEGCAAFFRCWARKEAFVKAVGRGLSYPLDRFEVSLDDAPSIREGGDNWNIAAPEVAGFACAVVAQSDGRPLIVTRRE